MVSKQTKKRKTVTKRKKQAKKRKIRFVFTVIALFFTIASLVVGISYLVFNYLGNKPFDVESSQTEDTQPKQEQKKEVVLPDKINFQPVIDNWVKNIGGNKSVLIYDIERDEIVGEYNSKESYSTASLYKLFVVYEGYKRVQSGKWNADAKAGSTGHTIIECLDLAIRESHSPCAETLWDMIGRSNLDNIIYNDFNIKDSEISKLTSNPRDIMKILKIFYEHKDITDEKLIARMKD